ncbi:MAG: acyl-CoA dehydrogenase family protein [Anaerolineaceae bacterium]|nr:MAG: acyl-CoA dehydrogenase family protein [Anaerolineaceae bacterium]
MDFSLPKEYQLFLRMVRDFTAREIQPLAAIIDREHRVPFESIAKAAQLGLMGVPFLQEYGGMGGGELGYCILMEEVNRVCTSTATIIGAHTGIGAMAIYLDGTEAQKQKFLRPLAEGKKIGAFALTEPGAGSDAAAIKTTAVRDGDHYILNGTKIFITNGNIADIVTVMAVTDPALGAHGGVTAFIVEKGTPGFSIGSLENKMGIRGSTTAELIFEDCPVPAANVLGQFGAGFITFMKTLDIGRASLGAACLGGAQAAMEAAIKWAKVRQQFGKPIAQRQSVHFMIADMATEIEALRSLIYRTAWLIDTGQPHSKEAAMCKLYSSEVATRCTNQALQIMGSMGYSRDFWMERAFRDARIAEIYEGTSEIQRIVIASNLFRQEGVRISP